MAVDKWSFTTFQLLQTIQRACLLFDALWGANQMAAIRRMFVVDTLLPASQALALTRASAIVKLPTSQGSDEHDIGITTPSRVGLGSSYPPHDAPCVSPRQWTSEFRWKLRKHGPNAGAVWMLRHSRALAGSWYRVGESFELTSA